jgi:IMP dehydrogenase
MKNAHLDAFMACFPHEGITFDDVSLVTQYADFMPTETDIASRFSRNITLNIPYVSAAMDTVTESDMAIAMARLGGIGVIHKNLTPAEQAEEVRRVKHYLNGLISKPVTFPEDITVRNLLDLKEKDKYQFHGFPIVDKAGRLVGILTARDVKFLTELDLPVAKVMTRQMVTGKPGMKMVDAYNLMLRHKVGKLPIVDKAGRLTGLYSFQDVKTLLKKLEPTVNRDEQHQLRVAAAIGPHDDARLEALVEAGVDAVVVDTAHGHSKGVLETVAAVKKRFKQVDVVAGNIATGEAAKALVDAGADAVKVGIGPGSICTTRVVAGVGIPQITAIYQVRKAVGASIPVIADGGIVYSGDVAKAIGAGADCVMMGSALAGTEESPGERMLHQGRTFVVYRGMGSLDAMKKNKGSRERYGHQDVADAEQIVPQGIEGLVPYRGPVGGVLHQYAGGLQFSLGYCGCRTVRELQERARFIRVSAAGVKEAHPHDVKVIKDAPNYRAS